MVSRELAALRAAGHTVDLVYYRHRDEADAVGHALGPGSTVAPIDRLSLLRATARRPRLPYQMSSRTVDAARLSAGFDGPYDLIICHHEWVLPLGAVLRGRSTQQGRRARLVLRSHNDEVLYYRALLHGKASLARRAYLVLEQARISRRLIRTTAAAADEIWLVSQQDEPAYAGLGVPCRLVPPILVGDDDRPSLADGRRSPCNVLFVGALDPPHAVQGLRWFLDEVWPRLSAELPAARFIVAGRRANDDLRRKFADTPGVQFLGEVDSLDTVLQQGRVFVNPVFAGSGINLKTGNPAERGIPVVTTSTGARGFVPGPGIVVADTPASYAESCLTLLTDGARWQAASLDAAQRVAAYSPAAFLRAAGLAGASGRQSPEA